MDKEKQIYALTAYGVSEGVRPETGATAQGAVESPVIFVLLMSWLCEYLDKRESQPYIYKVSDTEEVEIEKMFDSISKEYDFLNRIITFGTDAKNKKEITRIVEEKNPSKVLDIATGTADIPINLSKIKNCKITGVDISKNMIAMGRKKIKNKNLSKKITLEIGNAERLKYKSNHFDVITIGFGVRNFEYLEIGSFEGN